MLLPPPLSQKSKAGMVLDFAGWRRDRTQRPALGTPSKIRIPSQSRAEQLIECGFGINPLPKD
jgi:hypothetical protein